MPTKKQRCTFKECKDPAQRIVGDCGFCSGHFCGKHRLLEDHKCAGLEDVCRLQPTPPHHPSSKEEKNVADPHSLLSRSQCKKESHDANANKLNSERTTVIKGV